VLTLAIHTGRKSSRTRQDNGVTPLMGKPLIVHVLEPLHAVIRKETCLQAVKIALDDGQWKLISLYSDVSSIIEMPFDKVTQLDPERHAFFKINTP